MAKKKKNKKNQVGSFNPNSSNSCLNDYTRQALKEYGSEVVEDRAVPDYRDGLKPVHRALLWSMLDLGLTYTKGYKKAARTVGDVIGRFHPHGDMSAYGAMVTIANTRPNLVDGSGNWGSVTDPAAAPRYTEARLSEFSCKFLLDPDYLAVTPMVKNFSNDVDMPLFLPAKLPVQLLVGSPTVPAYGVSAGTPPFAIKGVVKLVQISLDREVTVKDCVKHLVPNFSYGGNCVSSKEDLKAFHSTGKGSLAYIPDIEVLYRKRIINIMSCSPGFASATAIDNKLGKIADIPGVTKVSDSSGAGIGAYNICYKIVVRKGVSDAEFDDIFLKVEKILTVKDSYDIGYTIRKKEGGAKFGRMSVVQFFNNWIKYRTKLEISVIKYLIQKQIAELERLDRLVFAVSNRKDIINALNSKDPDALLIKKWKKPQEFVKKILDLPVRRLAVIEKKDLLLAIKKCKGTISSLRKDLKNPESRIQGQIKEDVVKYVKKTSDKV